MTTALVTIAAALAALAAFTAYDARRRALRNAEDVATLAGAVDKLSEAVTAVANAATLEHDRVDSIVVAANALQEDLEQHKSWATPELLKIRAERDDR